MKTIDNIDKYLNEGTGKAEVKLIRSQEKKMKSILNDIQLKIKEVEKRIGIIDNRFGGSTLFDKGKKELKAGKNQLYIAFSEISDALNEIAYNYETEDYK